VIDAVLFDLDDTLYPQAAWLDGAWTAVARRAGALGAPEVAVRAALEAVAAEGTDRGHIIDRALAEVGRSDIPVEPLVAAFRSHAPSHLRPYPGVRFALRQMRQRIPIGLVTDGDPAIQQAKIDALDLEFDTIVLSDVLGRAHRKPDPAPLELALDQLGVTAEHAVMIGDRPTKDIAAARAVGMRSVRVRTGEYADLPDDPAPWRSLPDVAAACALLDTLLPRQAVSRV
jgi:putative hydrolase of the HAD superfamily